MSADPSGDGAGARLVVVAFLRGVTSPPPRSWFGHVRQDRREPGATTIVVPDGARRALILMAPDVGGGFGALVSAVRGRPGVFVHASQDLGQASLDRARLQAFLDGVHAIAASDTERLDAVSPVLPLEGVPLLYATDYARELRLRLATTDGRAVELPAEPDADRGGIVLTRPMPGEVALDGVNDATLEGNWGFERFVGPHFRLQGARPSTWQVPRGLVPVVGQESEATLESGSAACSEAVLMGDNLATARPIQWRPKGIQALAVALPLQDARAGLISLWIKQFDKPSPAGATLKAYEEASRANGFLLHAGDATGVLTGSRLDQVTKLTVAGVVFSPAGLEHTGAVDRLAMSVMGDRRSPGFAAGRGETTEVFFEGGPTSVPRNRDSPTAPGGGDDRGDRGSAPAPHVPAHRDRRRGRPKRWSC